MTSVRRATENDVTALAQIRNDAHAKKLAHRDYAWGKEGDGFSEQWVRNNLSQRAVYIVEQNATVVATFSLDLEDEQRWGIQEPEAAYVHGLGVAQGSNGRGLGRFMLDWCASSVIKIGRRYVRLDCPVHNAKLCAFYESLGFVRVGLWQDPGPDGCIWSLYEKRAGASDMSE